MLSEVIQRIIQDIENGDIDNLYLWAVEHQQNYAKYSFSQADNEFIDDDDYTFWNVVPTEYYEKEGYISDWHLDLEIPGFTQCMESTFETDLNAEQAREKLLALGMKEIDVRPT